MDTIDNDKRINPRSNIFVIATLYAQGGSLAVRIRNLSGHGALVEAATTLPPIGSPVRLCRGSLSVSGTIMWVDRARAGLHFVSTTAVDDWLPGGKRGVGQQMADELAHRIRLGEPLPPQPHRRAELQPPTIGEQLSRLVAELEKAGEDLAADAEVAARHPTSLQAIDAVAQVLARLAGSQIHGPTAAPPVRRSAAP
jgi:hypothetical protein